MNSGNNDNSGAIVFLLAAILCVLLFGSGAVLSGVGTVMTIGAVLTVVAGGSGRDPHEPSDDTRRIVVLGMLNGLSLDRTAAILGLTRAALERHYRDEIDDGADLALIEASDNMLWLAGQRADLGVALSANQALLAPRVRSWREPAAEPATSTGNIDDMDLDDDQPRDRTPGARHGRREGPVLCEGGPLMSQPCPPHRPYDGRDSLDPDLLRIAASGLVPLAFVAHRLGIDGTELLARHGYLLIEERDRLRRELLARLIDNPHADPVTLLALHRRGLGPGRPGSPAGSRPSLGGAWPAAEAAGRPRPSGQRKDRKGGQRKAKVAARRTG